MPNRCLTLTPFTGVFMAIRPTDRSLVPYVPPITSEKFIGPDGKLHTVTPLYRGPSPYVKSKTFLSRIHVDCLLLLQHIKEISLDSWLGDSLQTRQIVLLPHEISFSGNGIPKTVSVARRQSPLEYLGCPENVPVETYAESMKLADQASKAICYVHKLCQQKKNWRVSDKTTGLLDDIKKEKGEIYSLLEKFFSICKKMGQEPQKMAGILAWIDVKQFLEDENVYYNTEKNLFCSRN